MEEIVARIKKVCIATALLASLVDVSEIQASSPENELERISRSLANKIIAVAQSTLGMNPIYFPPCGGCGGEGN